MTWININFDKITMINLEPKIQILIHSLNRLKLKLPTFSIKRELWRQEPSNPKTSKCLIHLSRSYILGIILQLKYCTSLTSFTCQTMEVKHLSDPSNCWKKNSPWSKSSFHWKFWTPLHFFWKELEFSCEKFLRGYLFYFDRILWQSITLVAVAMSKFKTRQFTLIST